MGYIVDMYPYCEALHLIYLRRLYVGGDVRFDKQLMDSSMHISNRRLLYDYLHYIEPEAQDVSINHIASVTSDYFANEGDISRRKSLMELAAKLKEARLVKAETRRVGVEKEKKAVTRGEVKDYFEESDGAEFTFEKLASLAKMINVGMGMQSIVEVRKESVAINSDEAEKEGRELESMDGELKLDEENGEQEVRKFISERNYSEALRILKAINLNNPKKSVYFADQIQYLETILRNKNRNNN